MTVKWLDDARRVHVLDLAAELELAVALDGKSFGPCPGCGEVTRGKDKRGRCKVLGDGKGWKCYSNGSDGCGAEGDGPALVAWRLTGKPWGKGDQATSATVREWYAARRWCEPWQEHGAPLPALRTVAPPAPRPAVEPPARPPLAEVRELWQRCVPVTADPEVAAWLTGRADGAIDPAAVAALDLARALPAELDNLPRWARCAGRSWAEGGYRLLVKAWEADPEHPGRLRWASLHARAVRPGCEPKGVWPAGAGAAGLVLATGADPLAHGLPLVELAEGVPDWLRLVLDRGARCAKGDRPAVWGVTSGSAIPAVAGVVPEGWTVAIRTHDDQSGDKYAARWQELLTPRGCNLRREHKRNLPALRVDPPLSSPVHPPADVDLVAVAVAALGDACGGAEVAAVWAACCRAAGGAELVAPAIAEAHRLALAGLDGWELNEHGAELRLWGVA
jgi:hypothetical protein